MREVRWGLYPRVAALDSARTWLQLQANLQLATKTIDAYGRSLNDYLAFCARAAIEPLSATRVDIAAYVDDMTRRPNAHGQNVLYLHSGVGLSNATMQLRATAVRLFYDYLLETGLRDHNPVGRGKYTPGKGFYGKRDRGLIPHYEKIPWIPGDDQWETVLATLRDEPLRNKLMLLLAYEGALRRGELLSLEIGDIAFPHGQITIRPEIAKNRSGRIVFFGPVSAQLFRSYLWQRRQLGARSGPLFVSDSNRNRGQPLSEGMWNKIVERIATRAGVPQFTTHTLRHLRLTDMARCKMDINAIALYAGHRSIETTRLYIRLSGVELAEQVRTSMQSLDERLRHILEGGGIDDTAVP